MSLTGEQITAGKTYTVRIDKRALSFKRGNDAVALVKGINGTVEDVIYDPENPAAMRTGYVKVENPIPAVSEYDGAARTWAVTVPAGSIRVLSDLRTLAGAYSAEVTEGAPEPAAAPVKPRGSETRHASRQYGTDMAECADGFTPEERRAFGGR